MYIYFKDSDLFKYIDVKLKYKKNIFKKQVINVEANKSYYFDKEQKNINDEITIKDKNKYGVVQFFKDLNIMLKLNDKKLKENYNNQIELENKCGEDAVSKFIDNDGFVSVEFDLKNNTNIDIKTLDVIEIYDDNNQIVSSRNNFKLHKHVKKTNLVFATLGLIILGIIYLITIF